MKPSEVGKLKPGSWARKGRSSDNGLPSGADALGALRASDTGGATGMPHGGVATKTPPHNESDVVGRVLSIIDALETSCDAAEDREGSDVALPPATARAAVRSMQDCLAQIGDLQAKLSQVR